MGWFDTGFWPGWHWVSLALSWVDFGVGFGPGWHWAGLAFGWVGIWLVCHLALTTGLWAGLLGWHWVGLVLGLVDTRPG